MTWDQGNRIHKRGDKNFWDDSEGQFYDQKKLDNSLDWRMGLRSQERERQETGFFIWPF